MSDTVTTHAVPAPRADRTAAWAALQGHWQAHGRDLDLRTAFADDDGRHARLSFDAPEVHVDLSKQWLDAATLRFLADLARECGVEARRDAMLRGDPVNVTEGRAVLHTALRAPAGHGPHHEAVHAALDAMLTYAELVRERADRGELRHVVHIGIGGSDLGPRMAVSALASRVHPLLDIRFVANVDGHELAEALRGLDPQRTLVIVASKTFTTQETMANAATAKAWLQAGGITDVAPHIAATTTNAKAAEAFGAGRHFTFSDWVGGRYSLWSAIGLPIAIAIGSAGFRELLAGARAMDEHFATTPVERNVPLLLGLVDVWLRNFHGRPTRCIAPYHHGLSRWPAYLQQLEMESNGKRVDLAGEALPYATSGVVWGEPGTNAQHAYFQMLHQGHDVVPVEFVLVKEADTGPVATPAVAEALAVQHRMLLANGIAQAQALMLGRSTEEALREKPEGVKGAGVDPATLARHRTFPGNRPSTTFVLERLSPRALGAFVALHEHRVFTAGAVWGIDSFDQWGVELGKGLGQAVLDAWARPEAEAGMDASTRALLARVR